MAALSVRTLERYTLGGASGALARLSLVPAPRCSRPALPAYQCRHQGGRRTVLLVRYHASVEAERDFEWQNALAMTLSATPRPKMRYRVWAVVVLDCEPDSFDISETGLLLNPWAGIVLRTGAELVNRA